MPKFDYGRLFPSYVGNTFWVIYRKIWPYVDLRVKIIIITINIIIINIIITNVTIVEKRY